MIASKVAFTLWWPLTAARSLRSSSMGRCVAGWGRHITSGRSYTGRRAMGPCEAGWGRYIASGRGYSGARARGGQDERLLDPFIGRWKEISCQGFKEFLDASGVPENQQAFLGSAKLELVYTKLNDGHWQIESGFRNLNNKVTYTFQIGKMFIVQMPVGPLMECTVTQDGALWLENYKSVTKPHSTMTVTNETKGDTMTSVVKVKDVAVKRVFARE